MEMITDSFEYRAIKGYYKDRTASRSLVPLMNHIHEGIQLLISWDQDLITQRAWCIHPLVQGYQNTPASTDALPLADEYAKIASKYLCSKENDWINDPSELQQQLGDMSNRCAYMLLADKIQNQKDFNHYHILTHDRRHQYIKYFNLWLDTLITYYL